MRSTLLLSIVSPGLLACASSAPAGVDPSPVTREVPAGAEPTAPGAPDARLASEAGGSAGDALEASAASPAGGVGEASAPRRARPARELGGRLDPDFWRDADFRRRFLESYIAETDVEPRRTSDERNRLAKVAQVISEERFEEAQALLAKLRGPTASATFDFTAGNLHFQSDQLDEAVAAYRLAVEKHPKFLRAWKNLAKASMRRGDYQAASTAFARAIECGSNDSTTFGLLGYAHSNLGHPTAAESAYRMATLLDPAKPEWKQGLASALFAQRRFADCASLLDMMIREAPENADLWMTQAKAYASQGKTVEAAEDFEVMDRLGASTPISLQSLGDIYITEKLFELGVGAHLRALDLPVEAGQVDIGRTLRAARSLSQQGLTAEAERMASGIEERVGDDLAPEQRTELLRLRARLALARGAGQEEAEILRELVALDPLDGDALVQLGKHAARNDDAQTAIFYFERAAAIDKYEMPAKFEHAKLLARAKRYREAIPLLRRVLLLNPDENLRQYLEQIELAAKTQSN